MRLTRIVVLVACVSVCARAEKREVGQLVLDNVPEVPARISERAWQYQSARGATFLDWDPSGEGMLIATRFGDTAQVHHVAMPEGDRQQLTFFREPVSEALYAKKPGDRGFFFRMDSGGGEFYQYYWFERATGRHTLVTDGKARNEGLLASHAGARLAYSSTLRNGKDTDVYVMNGIDGRSAKRVLEAEGAWRALDWSPDDSKLLVRRYVSINESYLWIVDLVTGEKKQVNEKPGEKIAYGQGGFARKGGGLYLVTDEGSEFRRLLKLDPASGKREVVSPSASWDVEDLALSEDGAFIAYTMNEGGTSGLFLQATNAKTPVRIALPKGVVGSLAFDPASKRLALTMQAAQSPSDVFVVDLKTKKLVRWTQSEVGGINPAAFVAPELVTVKSFDGRALSGWYYRPRAEKAKAPVIVQIHGGPEAQSLASWSPLVQYWVLELGAAVLLPNVRGSSGYGKSFLLLDNGDKREESVEDLGAFLDWIGTRAELDAKRVAVYGGSYGGYMVLAALIRFADRIKCGVDLVGISSFVSFLERTESYRRDLRRAEYGDERDPAMRKKLIDISPLTHAKMIKAPLFVAQGKNDPRVPVGEAEQIVKSVRDNGSPVWYLLARDEGHGFQKRGNRDAFTNAVALFFEEYLLK
jgi:dipeptidyl aminopeptidase/acylaminoacyl peptidase